MLFISEAIVGLWFVPVVLYILLPLSMLCIWSFVELLKKLAERGAMIHQSAKEKHDEHYIAGMHSSSAS